MFEQPARIRALFVRVFKQKTAQTKREFLSRGDFRFAEIAHGLDESAIDFSDFRFRRVGKDSALDVFQNGFVL